MGIGKESAQQWFRVTGLQTGASIPSRARSSTRLCLQKYGSSMEITAVQPMLQYHVFMVVGGPMGWKRNALLMLVARTDVVARMVCFIHVLTAAEDMLQPWKKVVN